MNTQKAQHTPGPWNVAPAFPGEKNRWRITAQSPHVEGKMQTVCELNGPWDEKNYQANARLIASAPALLEACKAMVALLDQPVFAGLQSSNAIAAGDLAQGRKWLGSAIAQATGN
jgi:hypothetical protein